MNTCSSARNRAAFFCGYRNARMKMRSRATESDIEFPVRVRQLKGKNPPKEDYNEEERES